jgi:uncharacterized membrane protein YdbT with pleckstrin-like domain
LTQATGKSPEKRIVVRPSARLLKPLYVAAFVGVALVFGFNNNRADPIEWLMIFPALLFVWTLFKHLKLRFITLSLAGNKLRYETGMLSRTTRTLEISKVQDVRVDQTLWERLLGLGRLTIETAGDSSPVTMSGVERPQVIADYILEASHGGK